MKRNFIFILLVMLIVLRMTGDFALCQTLKQEGTIEGIVGHQISQYQSF